MNSHPTRIRDRIVYWICTLAFRLASPEYRALCTLTHRLGRKVLDEALDLDSDRVYLRVSTEPFTDEERA